MKKYTLLKTSLIFALLIQVSIAVAQTTQQFFPLNEVRLLPSPFLNAEKTDMTYILKLNADRLLAPFLREAGLKPKAESYGNWENTGLDGHTAGHYLTALAQMYASTSDIRFKTRLTYMIDELKRCQDNRKDNYVGGVPDGPKMWALVKQGDMSAFNKKWVPWYNLHKLFAGLRDAYLIGGNAEAKQILIKLSDWADQEVAGLSQQQMQNMLNTEYGGMNEVFADVAVITGDHKYLTLAKKFDHQAILNPLENHQDKLSGLHANTQIPKVIGFERIATLNNDTKEDEAARFFWETVVNNRSIAIGGNSVREHFNPTNDFLPMLQSAEGPETCNSYNMLKLTKMLFLSKPDARYMDYYERTLYNHILSSQHTGDGGFVYFTPIRPQHYRVYSQPQDGFWCCVGTGMENHGKYGEMIYSHSGTDLYVNLFIASVLNWKEQGVTLTQQNNFPAEDHSTLQIKLNKPKTFKMYIRQPIWVQDGRFTISVNGKKVTPSASDKRYIAVNRTWKNGDKITISMPMKTHLEYLPDHSEWATIVHGPIVLAAATDTIKQPGLMADGKRFGHVANGPLYAMSDAPLLLDNDPDFEQALKPVTGLPLTYTIADRIEQPAFKNLKLVPFYQLEDTRYMLYWPVAKTAELAKRHEQLLDDDRILALSRRTVDQVSPGEQQPESDHFMKDSVSETGMINNAHYREASGYFSYQMRADASEKYLSVTFYGEDKDRDFDIYLNDEKLQHVKLDGSKGDHFFTQEFSLNSFAIGKLKTITVKFVATKGSKVGRITDVRLLR